MKCCKENLGLLVKIFLSVSIPTVTARIWSHCLSIEPLVLRMRQIIAILAILAYTLVRLKFYDLVLPELFLIVSFLK